MKRDPNNYECTRDPIFLLQVGTRQWTEIPDGCGLEDGVLCVMDRDCVPGWLAKFIDEGEFSGDYLEAAESAENDNGWPYIYIEWRTELVFLTRAEAEEYGARRAYRWDKWRVYCVPCEGELAALLKQFEEAAQ